MTIKLARFISFNGYMLWVVLLVVSSCSNSEEPNQLQGLVAAGHYFDLKEYFEKEVERLGGKTIASKLVTVGDKRESKVDSVDFRRELSSFISSDINRPAWSDKYTTDSVFVNGVLTQLSTSAIDNKLKTQLIVVNFSGGIPSKVKVENNSSNFLATSTQVLIYEPYKGYSIESRQVVARSKDEFFRVEVRFMN